ncbi:hypothetical protein MRX96_045161 [Rhipicephalus microplus]
MWASAAAWRLRQPFSAGWHYRANVGSSLPSRVCLVLEAGFICIPLSVGGSPAVGLGFLFGDLLSFYHILMMHGFLGFG